MSGRLSGKVCVITADCDALVQLARGTCSDESSYVTGVDIVVDGGMKVW